MYRVSTGASGLDSWRSHLLIPAKHAVLFCLWTFIFVQSVRIVAAQHRYSVLRYPALHFGEALAHTLVHEVDVQSWSRDQGPSSWSVGREAEISFRLAERIPPNDTCEIILDLAPGLGRRIELALNGYRLQPLFVDKRQRYTEFVPCARLGSSRNQLQFRFPDVKSPRSLDISNPDSRLLGVGLVSLLIDRATPPR